MMVVTCRPIPVGMASRGYSGRVSFLSFLSLMLFMLGFRATETVLLNCEASSLAG